MLRILFLFIVLFFQHYLFAQNTSIESRQWPNQFLSDLNLSISDEFDSGSFQLQASIFDSISDIDLFSYDIDDRGSNISIKIKRDVFDNKDIANTFTVADTFEIPASIPIQTSTNINSGQISVGYNLGIEFGLTFTNIRQIKPQDISDIENLDELKLKLEQARMEAQTINENDKKTHNKNIQNYNKGIFDFFSANPRTVAQYSKVLNLLSHPLKLPITEKGLEKMPIGNISTYGVNGTIKLGASVGWSAIDIIGAQSANAGVGLTTYLNGKFKISILKEAENKVLVKLTKRNSRGYQATVGTSELKYEIFRGFVVSDRRIGSITESIIPFTLNINQENSRQFDIAYRYDLNDPEAKKAYFKAIFGNFNLSDRSACEDCSINKVFTRKMRQRTLSRNYKMKLTLLYERGHQNQRSHSQALITIGDKEHYVFESINSNTRGWDTLWGRDEQRNYRFTTTIKNDFFNRNSSEEVALSIEGDVEDSSTSSIEMARYLNEIEYTVGAKVFPPIPLIGPLTNCNSQLTNITNCKRSKIKFGKTDFYYKVNFSRDQLRKFINFPDEQMWPILEKAYGIKEGKWGVFTKRFMYFLSNSYASFINLPLLLVDMNVDRGSNLSSAYKFLKRWKKLKKTNDPEELSLRISKLFNSIHFNFSIVKILKTTISTKVHSFYVKGNADKAFGRIQKTFNYQDDRDDLRDYIDRVIEFDILRQRYNFDPNAIIESFNSKVVDSDNIRFNIDLKINPSYLFIRVDQTSAWKKYKNLLKRIYKNEDVLKKGENIFTVNRYDKEGLKGALAKVIFNNKYNDLKLAISLDNKLWGEIKETRFRIKERNNDN